MYFLIHTTKIERIETLSHQNQAHCTPHGGPTCQRGRFDERVWSPIFLIEEKYLYPKAKAFFNKAFCIPTRCTHNFTTPAIKLHYRKMVVCRVCIGLPCAQNWAHGKGSFCLVPPAKHTAKTKTHDKVFLPCAGSITHGKPASPGTYPLLSPHTDRAPHTTPTPHAGRHPSLPSGARPSIPTGRASHPPSSAAKAALLPPSSAADVALLPPSGAAQAAPRPLSTLPLLPLPSPLRLPLFCL